MFSSARVQSDRTQERRQAWVKALRCSCESTVTKEVQVKACKSYHQGQNQQEKGTNDTLIPMEQHREGTRLMAAEPLGVLKTTIKAEVDF